MAERAFAFFEQILCLNGGQFEGAPFVLEASQKFIVGSLFGWVRADGARRFRTAYIEQGKGNGKSPLVAGIGLLMLVADNEPRAEVYAFATKRDQAAILFRDAVAMVEQSPKLAHALKRSGGKGNEWNIYDPNSASFFRTISSDDAQSGPRPHCAIGDEIHEHKTGFMLQMMRAGFKFRRQPMLVQITNSGTDLDSVCWEQHLYGCEVAAGTREDDEFFAYVCALDEGDDPLQSEDCWVKANPLLDVAVSRDFLRGQVRESLGMPSKESTVRRLHFCQWVEAENPFISPQVWRDAADAGYDSALLAGRECYGGLDLSSVTDLTAFVLLFAPNEYDKHWRQLSWFWMPQDNIEERARRDRVPYARWRAEGWIETTPGRAVNRLHIASRLVACCERYDVRVIAYDRYRIEELTTQLDNEGVELPLAECGQGFRDMAPAVDEYERLLISGDLKHDGNPIMAWNATSAVVESDPAGNRKLTKARSNGRIDGLVAGAMAARAAKTANPPRSYQLFALG